MPHPSAAPAGDVTIRRAVPSGVVFPSSTTGIGRQCFVPQRDILDSERGVLASGVGSCCIPPTNTSLVVYRVVLPPVRASPIASGTVVAVSCPVLCPVKNPVMLRGGPDAAIDPYTPLAVIARATVQTCKPPDFAA